MVKLRTIKTLIFAALIAVAATSCITSRRANYLQDMTQGSQIELENKFEAKIAPYDELSIIVTSPSDKKLAEPFNIANLAGTNNVYANGQRNGYLVDVNGNIDFPILGTLHVEGMTRLQLQETISNMLITKGHIHDPYVMVRFNNFKVFFLGNGTGRVLNIQNERCTFLEALAMLNDVGIYTRRDHIGVMREVNGKMVMRYLDPRSSDVFNDPFFMLQQNDFIIAETVNAGTARSEFAYWTGLIGTVVSVTSLITSIILYKSISK